MESTTELVEVIHPEVQQALDTIDLPEVQELIKQISAYGLAVALPHMHGEGGGFLPLPTDTVAFESRQLVSFVSSNDPRLEASVPVMWRWDGALQAVASCATCDKYVCAA